MRMTSVWPIYAVIFLSGIGRSFARPSVQALSADAAVRRFARIKIGED